MDCNALLQIQLGCIMNMKQIKSFLDKLFNSSLNKSEFRQLMKNAGDLKDRAQKDKWLDQMESIDEEQNSKVVPTHSDDYKADFVNRLKAKSNKKKPSEPIASKVYHKKESYLWLKAAAVITVVLVALSFYFLGVQNQEAPKLVVHETLPGQKSTITIPDGTSVQLNAESMLSYAENFGTDASTREVKLEGEAFFNVKKDSLKPFIVHARTLKTTVLGTSFNVKSYANESEAQVVVATGQVSVENAVAGIGNRIILAPNEMVSYDTGEQTMIKQSGDFSDLLAWKDGRLIFDNVTIKEAIPELERWYGVEIILQNEKVGNCPIKVEIEGQSLHTVFKWLNFSMGDGFEYEIKDKQVLINGNGC